MRQPSIEQLRTFLTIYRLGSINKAALHLGMSQPTVATHLRTLERVLGQQLFQRGPRGVTPTAIAKRLADGAAPRFGALEEFLRTTTDGPAAAGPTLHLGGPATLTTTLVMPALTQLIVDDLVIRVEFDSDDQLIDKLCCGIIDLAIVANAPDESHLSVTPLFDEELVLVGPPRRLSWSGRDVADWGDMIYAVPFVACGKDALPMRAYWSSVFRRRLEVNPAVIVPDLRGVVEVVRSGAAVAVLPHYLVRDLIAAGELSILHEPTESPRNTLFLAVRSGHLDRHVAIARERLIEAAVAWSGAADSVLSGERDAQRPAS